MQKNVAGQKIGAQMVSATDGSAFTGSVTVYVTGDAGAQALGATGSGACTHEGNGYHSYAPSQAETNYDLIAFTFIGTGAVPATVQCPTQSSVLIDGYTAAGEAATETLIVGADGDTLETLSDQIDGVAASLSGGQVVLRSPVLSDQEIDIVRNADYYTADGRQLSWTISGESVIPDSGTLAIATLDGVKTFTCSVTAASGTGTTFHLTAQIDRATGAYLDAGTTTFDLFGTITASGHQIPYIAEGRAIVRQRLV